MKRQLWVIEVKSTCRIMGASKEVAVWEPLAIRLARDTARDAAKRWAEADNGKYRVVRYVPENKK